jgi:F0F1-type ATP synthase membrane subunit b/b'
MLAPPHTPNLPKEESAMLESAGESQGTPNTPPLPPTPPTQEIGIRFSLTQLLIWVTIVNFVLVFGGTVLTYITVPSIQKTYQEAESRINEAKARYKEASLALEENEAVAAHARAKVEKRKQQFDADLSDLEKDMKGAIARSSNAVKEDAAKRLQDATKVVQESSERINALGPTISELNIKIETKNKEIQDLQLTANRTLESVRETDKILRSQLSRLQQSRTIEGAMLWMHSDLTLRLVYGSVAFLIALSILLSAAAFVRSK